MTNLVFCLMGPTASGKTGLACDLVKRFPCEIVSVDSAMIYRGMDIGTAKPDAQTLTSAPHHLIDILDPVSSYSAALFCQDALLCCQSIIEQGKIPLLVGGTMMYLRAFQQGLSALPDADANVRKQIEQEALAHGWNAMHGKLAQIDPIAADRIHPHDIQRIQRALEVYALTGQSLSTYLDAPMLLPEFDFVNIMLMPAERAWLHTRIHIRFEEMLAQGLIGEVSNLLQQWNLMPTHPAMRCVGYRQVFDYLEGQYDYDTLRDKGMAATRQLAKRQLTWLRHWPDGYQFEAENPESADSIMRLIQQFCKNHPSP